MEQDPDDDEDEVAKLDRYYLSVLVKALMKILRDSALSAHHHAAGEERYATRDVARLDAVLFCSVQYITPQHSTMRQITVDWSKVDQNKI